MNIGRFFRTIRWLKPRQLWYQAWRRVQRRWELRRLAPATRDREPGTQGLAPAARDRKPGTQDLAPATRDREPGTQGLAPAARDREPGTQGLAPATAGEENQPLPAFTFLNLTATPKGWNDASLDLLWRYNLHYFDFLSAPLQPDTAPRPSPQDLIARWIAENPRGSAPGWDPYPTSLRIVNWVKWLGRSEPTEPLRASLAEQVAWLERHLEWHLGANHLLANLKALILGSRCLGRDDTRWRRLYREQLDEQVLPDGGHFERSVMYHAIILEDVLDVMRVCGATADGLKPIAARMLHYLVNLTGPDGKIALFNDAADGIAKPTAWLRDAARAGGVASVDAGAFADFPQTGYARLAAGDFVLFVDAAPIGPDYQPGHAHADTLTYELYYKGRKVVTDAGTSEYRGSRRAFERSTAAHNVVEVGGRDSSEVWSSHRVGARARIVARTVEPGCVVAAHDGYGFLVGREFRLSHEGLTVVEKVAGSGACVTRVHVTPAFADSGLAFGGALGDGSGCTDEDFAFAVAFGKLEKGRCVARRFGGGDLEYTIHKTNT